MAEHGAAARSMIDDGYELSALRLILDKIEESLHLNAMEHLPTSQMIICIHSLIDSAKTNEQNQKTNEND
jgi:hypothetical protein